MGSGFAFLHLILFILLSSLPLSLQNKALSYILLTKIQLTFKLRRKKGNFIQTKLRIITQEADPQKALRTVPPVRSRGHSHIHLQDKGSYIKIIHGYFNRGHRGSVVRVCTCTKQAASHRDPLQSWERTLFLLEVTLLASEERKKTDLYGVEQGTPIFEELWRMCNADAHCTLRREGGGPNTWREFYV